MLYLIHVWLRAFVAPMPSSFWIGRGRSWRGPWCRRYNRCSHHGSRELALAEESSGAVFEEVVDLDMIPDVAGIIRALTTANGYGATRRFVPKSQEILSTLCTACSTRPSPPHQAGCTSCALAIQYRSIPLYERVGWHGFHRPV